MKPLSEKRKSKSSLVILKIWNVIPEHEYISIQEISLMQKIGYDSVKRYCTLFAYMGIVIIHPKLKSYKRIKGIEPMKFGKELTK